MGTGPVPHDSLSSFRRTCRVLRSFNHYWQSYGSSRARWGNSCTWRAILSPALFASRISPAPQVVVAVLASDAYVIQQTYIIIPLKLLCFSSVFIVKYSYFAGFCTARHICVSSLSCSATCCHGSCVGPNCYPIHILYHWIKWINCVFVNIIKIYTFADFCDSGRWFFHICFSSRSPQVLVAAAPLVVYALNRQSRS